MLRGITKYSALANISDDVEKKNNYYDLSKVFVRTAQVWISKIQELEENRRQSILVENSFTSYESENDAVVSFYNTEISNTEADEMELCIYGNGGRQQSLYMQTYIYG